VAQHHSNITQYQKVNKTHNKQATAWNGLNRHRVLTANSSH